MHAMKACEVQDHNNNQHILIEWGAIHREFVQ
jgi:hypothetical protein